MTDKIEKIPTLLISAIILFAPLSFGAVHPWSIAILKSLILVVSLFLLWKILTGEPPTFKRRKYVYPWIAFILLIFIELLPLPVVLLKNLSPLRYNLLFGSFESLDLGQVPAFHSLSLNPHGTREMLSLLLFYTIFLFSVQACLANRSCVRFLSRIIIGAGFIVAFIAIAQKFSEARGIYWIGDPRQSFYGTFINPNHCAIFLSATGIFTFANFLKEDSRYGKIVLGFIFSLIAVAVFYSLSRGGILSFIIPLLLLTFFILKNTGRDNTTIKSKYLSLLFIILTIIVFILWWGTFRFVGELESLKQIDPSKDFRIELWKNSLRMFKDFFLFGTGLGTYKDIVPIYRSFSGNVSIEVAENDYVQILAETGTIGFAILSIFCYFIIRRASHILSKGVENIPRAQIGSIFALLSISLNSFINFNFQISGIMILALSFLAFISASTKRYG